MAEQRQEEKVTCGYCGEEHTVRAWESILCNCKVRIFSTVELRAKIVELDAKAFALRVEAGELQRELFYRERRRTMKDTKGRPLSDAEFWANVHGRPREVAEKVAKEGKAKTPKIKGREELL